MQPAAPPSRRFAPPAGRRDSRRFPCIDSSATTELMHIAIAERGRSGGGHLEHPLHDWGLLGLHDQLPK